MTWTQTKITARLAEIKADVEREGILTKGQKELIAFCEGESLTARQAIHAHCYQCMGYQGDPGSRDCENPVCPLYPFMPYSSNKRVARIISAEQREKMRLSRAR